MKELPLDQMFTIQVAFWCIEHPVTTSLGGLMWGRLAWGSQLWRHWQLPSWTSSVQGEFHDRVQEPLESGSYQEVHHWEWAKGTNRSWCKGKLGYPVLMPGILRLVRIIINVTEFQRYSWIYELISFIDFGKSLALPIFFLLYSSGTPITFFIIVLHVPFYFFPACFRLDNSYWFAFEFTVIIQLCQVWC